VVEELMPHALGGGEKNKTIIFQLNFTDLSAQHLLLLFKKIMVNDKLYNMNTYLKMRLHLPLIPGQAILAVPLHIPHHP
jgi:hypothetical protein